MEYFESLIRHFIDFDHLLAADPVGNGNINDTFHVRIDAGGPPANYILQRLNHRIFTAPYRVMDNISGVCKWLAQRTDYDMQVPAPLRTTDGQLLRHDPEDGYWRMFPYVNGAYSPEKVDSPDVAASAAGAYGKFFRALADYPMETLHETIPGFHDSMQRWIYFENCVTNDKVGRVGEAAAEIAALKRLFPVFEQVDRLKRDGTLPLRVTHNDTKAGNVLLDIETNRALAVIDLDTVMPGTVLSDFGDMVRTFTPNVHENDPDTASLRLRADVLRVLHKSYLENAGDFLTPVEIDKLPLGALWITAEQAMRFLSDYLAGDVYYKISYPDHNFVRARNQLALCEAIRQIKF